MVDACCPALESLRADHKVVLRRLEALQAALQSEPPVSPGALRERCEETLGFLDAEVWHHFRKEEQALFPFIDRYFPRENAPVAGGPVFVLTEEHGVLRRLVARLREILSAWEGDGSNVMDDLRLVGGQVVRAFQKHIYKEDNIVFRLAESLLPEQDKKALNDALLHVE